MKGGIIEPSSNVWKLTDENEKEFCTFCNVYFERKIDYYHNFV